MVRPRPILLLIAAACILALSTAFLLPAAAQDADGDGLPDAAEEQLGTDASFAEQLDLIAEDPAGESKEADNMAWLDVVGQGQSDRKKVVRIADTTESENFDVTWGLDTQRAIRKDDRNVVFTIQECEMEGFEEDIFTEYHMPPAKFRSMPARVSNGQALDRLSRDV